MRKNERAALQAHIDMMAQLEKDADEAFKKLQDLNGNIGTRHRWCCAKTNAVDLLKSGHDYMYLYDKYVQANAKYDLLLQLGSDLANLGFWKDQR